MSASVQGPDGERDYPIEQWYCAAFADEVGRAPLARTICDRQLVLYRTESGQPVALTDRCPHRQAPLSQGGLIGDNIECPFHGMQFAPSGACREIPCQDTIPRQAQVRSYPAAERDGHIWIWMGRKAADPALLPDMHWLVDPALTAVKGMFSIRTNYLAALDNLLDDSHLSFVHRKSIGTPKIVKARLDIEGGDDGLGFSRWTLDTPPSAMHAKAGGFTTNVDRWFVVRFVKPTTVLIDVGSAAVGTRTGDNDHGTGIAMFSNGTVTPSTANTCLYFWYMARTFSLEDAQLSELLRGEMNVTFVEDVDILESVQRNRECDREHIPLLNLAGDAVGLRARRIIAALIAQEGKEAGSLVA